MERRDAQHNVHVYDDLFVVCMHSMLCKPAGSRMRRMNSAHDGEAVVQVPQFILEDSIANGSGAATNIICTQPRRLPAVALANRVADEMCQQCGGLVGYSIRLEKKSSKDTRLLFCTTGTLSLD